MAKNKKGMNPVVAGAIGVAVGAAAGVAAVELANEKNREAVGEKMEELEKKGEEVLDKVKQAAGAQDKTK